MGWDVITFWNPSASIAYMSGLSPRSFEVDVPSIGRLQGHTFRESGS
jgi:hypothetical protein